MDNLKVKVENKAESKEAQELFFELGCHWYYNGKQNIENVIGFINSYEDMSLTSGSILNSKHKKLTIPQLRDLVVLKRNDVEDKNCKDDSLHDLYQDSDGVVYYFHHHAKAWVKSDINGNDYYMSLVKPIEKEMNILDDGRHTMKEFLVNHDNKWTLQLLDSDTEENSYRVAVPFNWVNFAYKRKCNGQFFFSDTKSTDEDLISIWQRSETESLNDQCMNGDKLIESIAQLKDQDTIKVTIDELKNRVGVDATLAERQATYGCFEDVAFVTENVMGVLSKARPNGLSDLPHTHRMALYMIASKMARIVNGDFNHLDGWHDIGGYAKLIENLIGDEDE